MTENFSFTDQGAKQLPLTSGIWIENN